MLAKVGDHIVVRGHRAGQPDRHCIVLVVGYPFANRVLVRWVGLTVEARVRLKRFELLTPCMPCAHAALSDVHSSSRSPIL
jgi:hypothetical protein